MGGCSHYRVSENIQEHFGSFSNQLEERCRGMFAKEPECQADEFTNVFSNCENQGSSTSRSEWLSYALSAAKVHVFNSHRETSTGMHNSIRLA